MISSILKIFIVIYSFFIVACASTFVTDNALNADYSHIKSNKTVAVYYNIMPDMMSFAIKNIGASVMTNIYVDFSCRDVDSKKVISYEYFVGTIKPYFNQTVDIPISYQDCNTIMMQYAYFLEAGDSFIFNDGKPYSGSSVTIEKELVENLSIKP